MQFDMQMDRDVRILGDENRLIQIFTNLISNAVTYSPDSTTITVKMTQNEEYGIVEVEDQELGLKNKKSRVSLSVSIESIAHVAVILAAQA